MLGIDPTDIKTQQPTGDADCGQMLVGAELLVVNSFNVKMALTICKSGTAVGTQIPYKVRIVHFCALLCIRPVPVVS